MNEKDDGLEYNYTPDTYFLQYLEVAATWNDERYRKDMLKTIKSYRHKQLQNEAKKIKKSVVNESGACSVCGFDFRPILQIHHVLPISQWGNNGDGNVICVCPNCHKTLHYLYGMFEEKKEVNLKNFEFCYQPDALKRMLEVHVQYIKGRCAVYEHVMNFAPSGIRGFWE